MFQVAKIRAILIAVLLSIVISSVSYAQLAAPVVTTDKSRGNQVTVSWNEITGATKYILYRWDAVSEEWKLLSGNDGITATSYVDTTVKAGITYLYTVSAVNSNNYSDWSNYSRARVRSLDAPELSLGNDGFTLSWNDITGAIRYALYYWVNEAWVLASDSLTGTTYVATSTGRYTVGGVTEGGDYGAWSNQVDVSIIATPTPTNTPTNTPMPVDTSTPTNTPTNTPIPVDTSTPTPTNTPAPVKPFNAWVGGVYSRCESHPTLSGRFLCEPAATPTPTQTTNALPTYTPMPPTRTPSPTRTPTPTATVGFIPGGPKGCWTTDGTGKDNWNKKGRNGWYPMYDTPTGCSPEYEARINRG